MNDAPATPSPPRRPRWLRRLALAGTALVLLVAAAPLYSGPILRRVLVRTLEARLGVRAAAQSVSFAWPARLSVRGLELTDASGARLAALDEGEFDLALRPLLSRAIVAKVALDYPEIHLARLDSGHWNWERVLAHVGRTTRNDEAAEREPGEPPELELDVTDGHVVIHGPRGETTLTDLALSLEVKGLDRPAPVRLSLGARGPRGAGGNLTMEGSVTAGRREHGVEVLSGSLSLSVEALDLAAFAPVVALVAPEVEVGGVLNGRTELHFEPGLSLRGTGNAELRELTLRGPRSEAAPTRVARLTLQGEASQDGADAGRQSLTLEAGSLLTLSYAGNSKLEGSALRVAGKLEASGELARMAEVARGWVPIQPGVVLEGAAATALDLTLELEEGRATGFATKARAGVRGLNARDAAGRALDLRDLESIALELEARGDLLRHSLSVPALSVHAGALTCTGRWETSAGESAGVTAGLPLARGRGAVHLEADLGRLRGTLERLVELGPASLGGQLSADLELGGTEDEGPALSAQLSGRALELFGSTLGTLTGRFQARGAPAGGWNGSGQLALGPLVLPLSGGALSLPAATLQLSAGENGDGQGEHDFTAETLAGALRLTGHGTSARSPGATTLTTRLELDAGVAPLAEVLQALLPLQPGLAGRARLAGDVRSSLSAGRPTGLDGRLRLALTELATRGANGEEEPLSLGAIALDIDGALDLGAGTAELRSLDVAARDSRLLASARLSGLRDSARPVLETGQLTLDTDLALLGTELARIVDLAGWSVGGRRLHADIRGSTQERTFLGQGNLTAGSVRLVRPTGDPLELSDVALDFDLGYDSALGSLHVRAAGLRSDIVTVGLAGTLNELLDPSRARGAMRLVVDGELARLLQALRLETAEDGRRTSGAWHGEFSLEGDRGAFHVAGQSTIRDFRLETKAADGAAPLVLEEPSIELTCAARVTLPDLDLELERLGLDSGLARGAVQGRLENLRELGSGEIRFRNVKGELAYVPDRLGPVLAPILPGTLAGAEEERATFSLDGQTRELGLAAILAGTNGRLDLGLGRFVRPEIELGGALTLEAKGESLLVRGDLRANGGTLALDGALELGAGESAARSKLTASAKDVRANAGLAPLLGLIHPVFAATSLTEGTLDGLIALSLDLGYDGPLSWSTLLGGWAQLPKEPIDGTGRLVLAKPTIRGSPLLAALAGFGVDVGRELDLRPIEFAIQKGRILYAKPWTWTFAGTETTFTGSIGLDRSVALDWNIPISERLVERYKFLGSLRGERLALPLRGTLDSPRLEAEALLADLAAKVAERELAGRLGLGDGRGENPSDLLARADALWSKGQKREAAALYLRLREDYKLSLPYALNKDRIRERSKYQEPR